MARASKKTAFPELVFWLWVRCLEILSRKVMRFDSSSAFARFQHIWLHDGSSQAVYGALKDLLPGRFKEVSPAAVEMHATVDLLEDNFVRVQMTEDTRSERACLPALQASLAWTLILIDAGYFDLEYFGAVDDREGSQTSGFIVLNLSASWQITSPSSRPRWRSAADRRD